MNDFEIIQKFYDETNNDKVVWKRVVKNITMSKTAATYTTKFIGLDIVEIAPTQYTDTNSLMTKHSYRLSFYDGTSYCYKNITGPSGSDIFQSLKRLFDLIEAKTNNLDNKLNDFFKSL